MFSSQKKKKINKKKKKKTTFCLSSYIVPHIYSLMVFPFIIIWYKFEMVSFVRRTEASLSEMQTSEFQHELKCTNR